MTDPDDVQFPKQAVGLVWSSWLDAIGLTGRGSSTFLEEAFVGLVASLQVATSIEVGAHEASYSVALSDAARDIRCIALEANPMVFERYDGTLGSVDYRNLAATADNQSVEFLVPRRIPARGELRDMGATNRMGSLKAREGEGVETDVHLVPGVSLDSLVTDDDTTLALWIDVEGGNGEVLAGALAAALPRTRALYIELETRTAWRGALTSDEVDVILLGAGLVMVARDAMAPFLFNAVYVPSQDVESGPVRAFVADACRRALRTVGGSDDPA